MYLLLGFTLLCVIVTAEEKSPKIGIVGAGIGGASVGYFLSRNLPGAEITVFEKGEVGGRLATEEVDGRQYESGGAIIHAANRYMVEYLDICGLKKRETPADESFTLHKDGEVVFQEWGYSLVDKARMAWKYGIRSLLKLETFFSNVLASFLTIYDKLESGAGFSSVGELLEAMDPVSGQDDVLDLTKISLKDKLATLDLDSNLVKELVTVATKFNYGQLPDSVHAFVGAVGLIGFDKKLWAVEGGNYRVAQCALELSRAKVVKGEVTEVLTDSEGSFNVKYSSDISSDGLTEKFDLVIIAAPLTSDKASLSVLPSSQVFPGSYHTTIATIVRGELISEGIGYNNNSTITPNNFYLSPTYPMWSVEKLTPVDYNRVLDTNLPPVYKLFSSHPFSSTELSTMFSDIKSVSVTNWLAYPSYSVNDDLTSFQLVPGLFYTSRIEWAASAMEMSVIAAKNVANLAADYLNNDGAMKVAREKTAGLRIEL